MVRLDKLTRSQTSSRRRDLVRLFWTACVLVFVFSMISCPQVVFQGALTGLKTWWNIVFPALLPFFIASELLMSFGVVHFMGVLLEPVMRPLFNVPGAGSFVMAIGYTSGYPIGSMVTARLRAEGLCSRVEAERLMSFTNNSSPLFMLGAVAVGMFNNPATGVIIAGAHYLSNLVLGFILRFYARSERERFPNRCLRKGLLRSALHRMLQVQRQENRPLGKIMGDAVRNAVTNLLNIGGFIILFAVIIQLLFHVGFINTLAGVLGIFLLPLGFSPEILPALGSGFFEMTIGSRLASEAAAPLLQQLVAIGMILAWSGLSVHAQAASMIAETDIRMLPFVISRLAHACLAGIFTYLFCRWRLPAGELAAPALAAGEWQYPVYAGSFKMLLIFFISLAAFILFALLLNLARSIFSSFLKIRI
ncbi:MAG TPA: sporulation integral membrane protein YlbJ [Bacillota bacterium]|nr:sporulation integral membrane protein YlbJ [Peptococcaceae bacterium MAG4]NLW37444.1 sporulation integral membrane protein YlbJ [Peptococcaceae bacterium]HPZ43450.1 sporulation integral membrane protein YlbJ [Bacillota bacterium]HQD76448.1 sporulation integral membrane protein YlbJ [Bacillota bacterium]HUM58647.1 sporulation integral membrane protein YlbJ [Bacillota bacterium]